MEQKIISIANRADADITAELSQLLNLLRSTIVVLEDQDNKFADPSELVWLAANLTEHVIHGMDNFVVELMAIHKE